MNCMNWWSFSVDLIRNRVVKEAFPPITRVTTNHVTRVFNMKSIDSQIDFLTELS